LKVQIKKYLILILTASLVVIADQWSKAWVRANIPMGEMWSPWDWLTPYARLVHWYNTGVAFGMFQGMSLLFTILAIVVVVVILLFFPRVPASDWYLRLALGLQLGGALGNLIDRVLRGHVTDLISIMSFPVFNIADASISTGVAILLLGVWMQERELKKLKGEVNGDEISGESRHSPPPEKAT
jgi:signal peptidase II